MAPSVPLQHGLIRVCVPRCHVVAVCMGGWAHLQIPAAWRLVSFSTLKPLSSWLKDVTARVEFLRTWLHDGPPVAFPLAYFFFPQVTFAGPALPAWCGGSVWGRWFGGW